ncbi:MAG: DUF58 domain-containing protein [Bdellovibrionota bacterium]
MSLPPEILKKVKLLEINTRKLVNSLFAGQYHSAYKGQGMTFAEFREYVAGDDVRAISWPVTARTGKTHIKKFDEERELTLMLVVDISGSLGFGSGEYLKGEVVTHLSALLGFAAAKNNDHVGLLLFSDQVEHYVPPKKGRGHIQRILRDLYFVKPKSQGTKISAAVDHLQGLLKKRATVFVFSDFQDKSYGPALRMMAKKHDVVAVVVQDPVELDFPAMGLVDIQDAESGHVLTVDSSSPAFKKAYKKFMSGVRDDRERELRTSNVDRIEVVSGAEFIEPLIAYFRRKNGRRR